MPLIIDGYNLIFSDLWQKFIGNNKNSADEIDSNSPDFLEKARDGLIIQLKSYNTKKLLKIIVIFDGDENIGYQSHQTLSPHIEIIFSNKKSKADNLIIDIASYYMEDRFNNKNNQIIAAVTSDCALIETLAKSGVKTISTNEFIKELLKANQIRHHPLSDDKKSDMTLEDEPIEKFIGLSPLEAKKWLKVFEENDK